MSTTVRTDYHMHSNYSLDGHYSVAEICQQAVTLGLQEIAVTDHVEWEPNGRHTRPDFERYFADLEECRRRYGGTGLRLYSGLELGNPHENLEETRRLLDAYAFDVVIASLHWLNGHNIHHTSCFAGRDQYDVYTEYFIGLGQMAATVDCRLIAHFDRIFWPGTQLFGPPDPWRIELPIRNALQKIVGHQRVLELNTRFVTHDPSWNDVLVTILEWYHKEGGCCVAINSDAHHLNQMARNVPQAIDIVQAAGFSGSAPFRDWSSSAPGSLDP
jgi:histidinol-phosphatase (PHP family)